MLANLFTLILLLGIALAIPALNFHGLRRLDPSQSDEVDDFDKTQDGPEFPDSPTPPDNVIDEDSGDSYTSRQENRLALISARYDELNAQESQALANAQVSDANQELFGGQMNQNEADSEDLRQYSDWLRAEGEAFERQAAEHDGSDADNKKSIGSALKELSDIAGENADLEQSVVQKQKEQVGYEVEISELQRQEADLKEKETELEYDQLNIENDMIRNEKKFDNAGYKLNALLDAQYNQDHQDHDEAPAPVGPAPAPDQETS